MSELFMRAYYHTFQATGEVCADRILSAVAKAGKAAHHTADWGDEWDRIQGAADETAEEIKNLKQRLAAANGRLEEYEKKTCNCRWEGETLVRQCELHKAQVDAIHEWAERAKVAEQRLWKLGLRNYQKRPVQKKKP